MRKIPSDKMDHLVMNMRKGKCILREGKFLDKKMMPDTDIPQRLSFPFTRTRILYGEEGSRGKGEWQYYL